MNDARLTAALERLAEAIVFEHEDPAAVATHARALGPGGDDEARSLRDCASLCAAAFAASAGPMPERLRARLGASARAFAGSPAARVADERVAGRERDARRAPQRRRWSVVAFASGAAAGFAASLLVAPHGAPFDASRPFEPPPRAELIAAGAATVPWQAGPSTAHGTVDGDVVWDQQRQQVWLRVHGLEPLGPDRQYQLWVVDAGRTGAPVDGGLFDVPSPGEHLVPLRPKLPIDRADAFVVTVERRGGVVVSDQTDVVAIARR